MKPWLWNLGWGVLAAAWFGPLPSLAAISFTAHMTLHMSVVAIASPLLSLGIAGTRHDPVNRFPRFFSAIPASIGELVIVWAWHSPGLHHVARHTGSGFVVEQAFFLFSGVWIWLSAFGGTLPRRRQRCVSGVLGLLLTSVHMTLLGALLTLSQRQLFHHRSGGFGLSPLADQQLGGAVMLVVGGAAFLIGGLVLTGRLLQSPHGDARLNRNDVCLEPVMIPQSQSEKSP